MALSRLSPTSGVGHFTGKQAAVSARTRRIGIPVVYATNGRSVEPGRQPGCEAASGSPEPLAASRVPVASLLDRRTVQDVCPAAVAAGDREGARVFQRLAV